MDKYIGKRLDGRYELRELIGVGGMAYVYKAYDIIDDSIVAVKVLKDEYLHNEEFSRRFKNESKAIAILSHKNIVRVNDVSFSDTLQYIVMEYIDGITLKEYIEQQKVLRWKEVVHFIVQILQALQHAHDKGIVHQDVKPQNIMLLSDGTIKVTDFGIARFSRANTVAEQSDKAIGSVHYISPEQARAEITDEKSDIYSVGVMMYEMLTGKLPFESDNAVSVAIMQMQSEAERPTVVNPDIPEGLEEITLKAMQKDPMKRYQSAAEMLYDIDEFKNNPSIRFEYKYFSGADDAAHYEEAFSRIRRSEKRTNREEVKEEKEPRKGPPILPILAGIAGAFLLILVVVLGVYFTTQIIAPSTKPTQNVVVPDLVGKNYETDVANNTDLARDFTIKINEEYSKEPVNTIIKQYPLPDKEVKLKAELVLYISRGEQLVKVPEIEVGADQKTAAAKLSAAGFTVKEVTANSDKVEKGCVIRIDPVSGEELAKGSTVTMYVSIGEEPVDNVVVPDVVGRAQEDAIKRLTEKGLKVNEDDIVRINHPSYSAGVVIETNPAMGDSVAPDTKVILTVSSGYKDVPVSINMPDVSAAVDMDIYIDDDWWYSQEDITSNAPMSFTFDEQKDSYTVTVELSKAGANDYQTYAVFEIDGESGSVTSSEYSTFTIKTTTKTKATTTTTAADEDDKVTTTTALDDEDARSGEDTQEPVEE